MKHFIQVVTTVDRKDTAEKIAEYVLEQKLAACVQISSCQSMFWWQGKVEKTDEYVCTMKSRDDLYLTLEEAVREIHPYDVPEIMSTPVLQGSDSYLAWLDSALQMSKPI